MELEWGLGRSRRARGKGQPGEWRQRCWDTSGPATALLGCLQVTSFLAVLHRCGPLEAPPTGGICGAEWEGWAQAHWKFQWVLQGFLSLLLGR